MPLRIDISINHASLPFSSIIIGTFLIIYFVINIFYDLLAGDNRQNLSLSQLSEGVSKEYTWALRLTINCIGYSGKIA